MNHHPLSEVKRLWILGAVLAGLFSLLVAHYYQIQIVEHEKWLKEASKQHFFVVKEPFRRGRFFSNTEVKIGHPVKPIPFVNDIEKHHLYIDPQSIPPSLKKNIAEKLKQALDLDKEEGEVLKKQFLKKSRNRKVASWLDQEVKEEILMWWRPFARKNRIASNALYFVADNQRSYPYGKLLGQVLHTVQTLKDEKTDQSIPTGGLELSCNRYLKGCLGKRRLMRSPFNSLETGEVLMSPENGADVYLTINHVLQAIAEEELEKGVKKCKAKSGWAVMMDPYNGHILALAQYPFFYPPDYQAFFNDPLLMENAKIKAVTDANEPGSIIKSITLAIALLANKELAAKGEKPLFSVDEKIPTDNGKFPGRSKPIVDTTLHHFLNFDMALQRSSSVYAARLVERIINRLGPEWYRNALQDIFGFGTKTGIQLPAESWGVLPLPGKKHPNGTFEWSTSTPFSIAMGYNIQATTLQMLRAYTVLLNQGKRVDPTLIKKIVKEDPQGKQTILYEHIPTYTKVLDEDICARVLRGMKFTTKKGGTSRKADIWGYTEGGKSCTAKKIVGRSYSETQYIGAFLGVAPINKPAFILLVTMDEPEYGYIAGWGKNHNGGTCSAPVFRDIARRSLEYLGIPPDDPFGYPSGDPRHDPKKGDWYEETESLMRLYEQWNRNCI